MRLLGANPRARAEARELQAGRSTYFIGNDPGLWRKDTPQYGRAEFHQVYPGIDLAYYGTQQQLEYDWVVGPGADPLRIRLGVEGADSVRIDAAGDLVLTLGAAEIRQRRPIAYQETPSGRQGVACRYMLRGRNRVGLEVGGYDRRQQLIIDPTLVFSTYYGGNGADDGRGIKVDAEGNIYIGGTTASTNLSATALGHAFVNPGIPSRAGYIAKISSSGVLVWAAYVAGTSDNAFGNNLAIDKDGNAYLVGSTKATDFPTLNAIQSANHGGSEAFVLEVSSSGNSLVYSTYLGGPGQDYARAIQVDESGNAYVTGVTAGGPGFPLLNAEQSIFGGSLDTFAAKIAPGGSLLYCTYIGGNQIDYTNGVAIDSNGDLITYGDTGSSNFPVKNAYQPKLNGGPNNTNNDGWFAKLDPYGALIYASYIGGSGNESVRGAQEDANGDLYLAGETSSTDFPTLNPIQAHNAGGTLDAWVAELNPDASALIFSTYWGGSNTDSILDLELDPIGNVYVTGYTYSTDFPTVNPTQKNNGGGEDAFLTKMNAGGSTVFFSTYLGGSGTDYANQLAVDVLGRAYITGSTSGNFPTVDPMQPAYGGSGDAFVAILGTCDFKLAPPNSSFGLGGGSASVAINTTPECGWTASSNDSWITLTSAASGVGSGSVSYSVASNPGGSEQTGTITLGTQTFSVTQSASAPTVGITPPSLNFGLQVLNTSSASRAVTLTNTGTAQLNISAVALSGPNSGDFGLSGDTCTGAALTPNGACNINVTFTPSAVGGRSASLGFIDNAGGSPQSVSLTGVAPAPVAGVSPPSLTFANQNLGTTSGSQPVTLSNTGNAALTIASIAASADFGETDNCAGSVAAGGSCTINVTFSPAVTGPLSGTLTITDNNNMATGSTQTVNLNGTGTAPVVSLSSSNLSFGSQLLSTTSATQMETITNTGTGSLSISTVTIGGTNVSDFAKSADTCT